MDGLAALRTLTINHHNAGLAGLQDLSIDAVAAADLHETLFSHRIESVVVRTCNRTELYWHARSAGDDETATRAFATTVGSADRGILRLATALSGEKAAAHLFRVCCGLESLVLGEAEILGQVRASLEASSHAGPFLTGIIRAGLRAGGAARAETTIGVGAMSVASMAVQWLARAVPLEGRQVLIIGAGETGQKLARQLRSMKLGRLEIANRTHARAVDVASSVGAEAVALDGLTDAIARADAVICAAGGAGWIVRREQLQAASGRQVPLHVIDLAMPAGIEPGDVPGVRRIDLAGLQHLVEDYRRQREAEIPLVEAVIARELGWLQTWAQHHAMRPILRQLYASEAS